MCSWLLITVESKHTHTHAKCTSSSPPVRWIICGRGMWFLLSNVVCNGIPCYLESLRKSMWEWRPQDTRRWKILRVSGCVCVCVCVWAQIQPLAHIIHAASPRQTATVAAWAFVLRGSQGPKVFCRSTCLLYRSAIIAYVCGQYTANKNSTLP